MLCDLNKYHEVSRRSCVPNSPFSMTSKVVQKSSAPKVTLLILSAVSASSVDPMLGETYRKHNKRIKCIPGPTSKTSKRETIKQSKHILHIKAQIISSPGSISPPSNHLSLWRGTQYLTCNTNCADIWLAAMYAVCWLNILASLSGVPERVWTKQNVLLNSAERKWEY